MTAKEKAKEFGLAWHTPFLVKTVVSSPSFLGGIIRQHAKPHPHAAIGGHLNPADEIGIEIAAIPGDLYAVHAGKNESPVTVRVFGR